MPRKDLKLLLLPGLTGLLGIACFPKANQGYLAWVAIAPLILFLLLERRVGRAFSGGALSGMVQAFGLLIWMPAVLTQYGGLSVWLAWVLYVPVTFLLAAYSGLACALTRYCMNRCGESLLWLIAPAWVTMEYVQNHFIFGGFPWLMAGYSQTDYATLIQVADITGVFGVSFLILWINAALAWLWSRRRRVLPALLPLASGLAVALLCLLYGRFTLERYRVTDTSFRATLLQPNMPLHDSGPVSLAVQPDVTLRMAEELRDNEADLLVMPEAPNPRSFQDDRDYREELGGLAMRFPLGLVVNNVAHADKEGQVAYYNSSYFLNNKGETTARYDKIHLVPFGEYIPWKNVFFFAETVSRDVGGFVPGSRIVTVAAGNHFLNAIICFEAAFPSLVRRFVRNGSQLIVNQTNDGWYGDSAAPYQHLAIARWRAIENRRFFLRAANSGISAVIEPTGEIQAATSLMTQAVCRGRFAFLSEQTIYARSGDAFALLCAIITCSTALLCYRRRPASMATPKSDTLKKSTGESETRWEKQDDRGIE